MKTAAVVTVTNGKRMEELKQCAQSIANQTYPCEHYILCDGDWYTFNSISEYFTQANVCFWNKPIGGRGYAGQRWLAAAPQLITEDVTFFCNDDDWYEENHVQTIMEKIEEGNDWAYSFRKINDEDGNFLLYDNCEALGEVASVWNAPGHHFVDWCMWGMRTDCLKQIAIILNRPDPQADRHFYAAAREVFPKFAPTGLHTFNFRLGGHCGVKKEYFEIGNIEMLRRFNGKLPWIIT
jgi:glycosyltransferase involved in cell wall biosynthesis